MLKKYFLALCLTIPLMAASASAHSIENGVLNLTGNIVPALENAYTACPSGREWNDITDRYNIYYTYYGHILNILPVSGYKLSLGVQTPGRYAVRAEYTFAAQAVVNTVWSPSNSHSHYSSTGASFDVDGDECLRPHTNYTDNMYSSIKITNGQTQDAALNFTSIPTTINGGTYQNTEGRALSGTNVTVIKGTITDKVGALSQFTVDPESEITVTEGLGTRTSVVKLSNPPIIIDEFNRRITMKIVLLALILLGILRLIQYFIDWFSEVPEWPFESPETTKLFRANKKAQDVKSWALQLGQYRRRTPGFRNLRNQFCHPHLPRPP